MLNNNSVEILADSMNVCGNRLTTFKLSFPKCLLAELNTHRMLSKNAASSRAVPASKMRQRVLSNGFSPSVWGANKSGMQSDIELSGLKKQLAIFAWEGDKFTSLFWHWLLSKAGLHKQNTNRIIEAHLYADVIVSGTEWENFFKLRASKEAQPEFAEIAYKMQDLMNSNAPSLLDAGKWHMPFISENNNEALSIEELKKISSAMCARVSHYLHDGSRSDVSADLALCEKLIKYGHFSPLEHVALSLDSSEKIANFSGFCQYRHHKSLNTML